MYGSVDNMEVTDEVIANVKAKMEELIARDLPITKVMMTQEEAEEFYKKEATIKGRLQTRTIETEEIPKHNTVELVAEKVTFLSSKKADE